MGRGSRRPGLIRRDSALSAHRLAVTSDENENDDATARVEFTLRPEMVRFVAYCFFWVMCIISIILAKHVVNPILLAGPTDGKSCPPFESGEGFDLYTESHLIRVLGYNNICANWDYSPAREILAVYFPLFEYSLILYIVTDYINVLLHWKKGLVSTRCYRTFQLLFLPILIGCALFRLIFVIIAYENVAGHTFGFMMLQIALLLVACTNVWFVVESKVQYRFLYNHTREFAYAYLLCNFVISALKLYLTGNVVFTSTQAEWAFTPVGNSKLGVIIDRIWMVFNAGIPMVLCFVRARTENPLEISIDVHPIPGLFKSDEEVGAEGFDEDHETPHQQIGAGATQHRQGIDFQTGYSPTTKKPRNSWFRPLKVMGSALEKSNISRPPLAGTHPDYPFENVVFQGGGAKGAVYTGAIQALDELGILPYLKRFAGTSAGTIAALTLALGLDAKQASKEMNNTDISQFFDAKRRMYGYNLATKLGIHPAKKCIQYLEDLLERYTGDKNLTFLELYQRYGTELCVSVSNISRSQAEYFHVNTTPAMPIKIAIRTSMSLPYSWMPMTIGGDLYLDGGLFNNYPLKAFDGWFLSTRKGDGVISKAIQAKPNILDEDTELFEFISAVNETMASSFTDVNMKTIGFRVSSESSPDQAAYSSYLTDLETKLYSQRTLRREQSSIVGVSDHVQAPIRYPPTKLAQSYRKKKDLETKALSSASTYEDAYIKLMRWLVVNMNDQNDHTSDLHPQALVSGTLMRKLQSSPPEEPLTPGLFGYSSWSEVVASMDPRGKGYITRTDLAHFWGRFGVRHAYMKNREPAKPVTSIPGLMLRISSSMHTVFEENLLRDKDNASRTCTLNTYYVDTYDIELEKADKEFLAKHGKAAALQWINEHTEYVGKPAQTIKVNHFTSKNKSGVAQMRKRFARAGVADSAFDNEEKVEEAHKEAESASSKDIMLGNGMNEKEKRGNDEEMEEIKDSERGRKVEEETWEQFRLFRDLLKSVNDSAENKGTVDDEAHEDGDFDEENTPQSKDSAGDDYKESNREAIDPPSDHDHQALVNDQPDLGSAGVFTMMSWLKGGQHQ